MRPHGMDSHTKPSGPPSIEDRYTRGLRRSSPDDRGDRPDRNPTLSSSNPRCSCRRYHGCCNPAIQPSRASGHNPNSFAVVFNKGVTSPPQLRKRVDDKLSDYRRSARPHLYLSDAEPGDYGNERTHRQHTFTTPKDAAFGNQESSR